MEEIVFWTSLGVILYVYVGYPLILWVASRFVGSRPIHEPESWPNVTLLIAAHNEEKVIRSKIKDSLELDYPSEKLQILVASDGSTDKTCEIAGKYSDRITLVKSDQQIGKSAIQNKARKMAKGEIIIFSDAPTKYDKKALRNLVRNFSDPKIGLVTGRVSYINKHSSHTSHDEGLYWSYEALIRELESQLGILAMGSGCILAVRKALFSDLKENVGEDFVLPLEAVANGYRVLYEKEAVAYEGSAEKPKDLFKTKSRIISKDLNGLFMNKRLLNPFAYPAASLSLISHKLLRWLIPFFMLIIILKNLFLLDMFVFQVFMAFQLLFYGSALLGCFYHTKIFSIPFNFCLVNMASAVGVINFIIGRTSGSWIPQRG